MRILLFILLLSTSAFTSKAFAQIKDPVQWTATSKKSATGTKLH